MGSNQAFGSGNGGGSGDNVIYIRAEYITNHLPSDANIGDRVLFNAAATGLTNYYDADGTARTTAAKGHLARYSQDAQWVFVFDFATLAAQAGFDIDSLTATQTLADGDFIAVYQGGSNKKITKANLLAGISAAGFEISATAPSNPGDGYLWSDTASDTLKIYNGSAWQTLGGSGGVTYTAGTGITIASNTISVTNPFTAANETKLNNIEAGAEVNPKHEVKFSAQSADTADGVQDSEIGFYNGSTQIQSGNMNLATRIDVPDAAATFGQNPASPGTDLDAVNTTKLFGDTVENGGQIKLAIAKRGSSNIVYVQAEVIHTKTGGWSLSELSFFGGETIAGTNDIWNIVGAIAHGFVLTKDVADLDSKLSEYPTKEELAGRESDRYASYNNAFVQNSYRRGDWVLTTDTSGPPTEANQVRQPDITSGTYMVCFSVQLRTDADPNQLQWATPNIATDYTIGQVIYASLDRDKGSHLKMTLTSAGTLVSSGNNSGYIYAIATCVETGNIANVQVAGDYFKLSVEEPSSLQIEIPYTDILGAPWVLADGSNVTDAFKAIIQGKNEAKTLTQTFRVDVSNVDYYAQITLAGGVNTNNTMRIRIPSSVENTEIDNDLERLLLPHAWVKVGGYTVDITTNVTRSKIGTSITYNFNFNRLTGTVPTGSTPVNIRVIGEDVHRGELLRFCFENEDWEDVLTDIGTIADDDKLLLWDQSAQDVKRVDKSVLVAGTGGATQTTIATDLSTTSSQFAPASSYQTSIITAWNNGKDILLTLRHDSTDRRISHYFHNPGIDTINSTDHFTYYSASGVTMDGNGTIYPGTMRLSLNTQSSNLIFYNYKLGSITSLSEQTLSSSVKIAIYSVG